jgi:hypothetical protein
LSQSLWKEPCLHLLGYVQFLGQAALGLQFLRRRAAFGFDFANEIISSHERKGVSIQAFKASENSAPKRSLQRMVKANPTPLPLIEFGRTACLQRPISLYSSGLRLRVTRARTVLPSGGATATQRPPDSQVLINYQAKSELVHVEPQTSILIANEDVDTQDAKIRVLPLHPIL